jgi:hypothetical protein
MRRTKVPVYGIDAHTALETSQPKEGNWPIAQVDRSSEICGQEKS